MDGQTTVLVFGTCYLAFMLVTVSEQQSFGPCLDNDLSKVLDGRPFGPLRLERPQGGIYYTPNIPSQVFGKRGYLPPEHTVGSSTKKSTFPKKINCVPSNRIPPQVVPTRKMPLTDGNYARPIFTFLYRPATKDGSKQSSPRVNYKYPSDIAKIPSFNSAPFPAINKSFSISSNPTLPAPFASYTYLPPKSLSFKYKTPKPTYHSNSNQVAENYASQPIKFKYALQQVNQQVPIPSFIDLPPHRNITSISLPSRNISIFSTPGTSLEFRVPPSRHRVDLTYLPPLTTPKLYTTPRPTVPPSTIGFTYTTPRPTFATHPTVPRTYPTTPRPVYTRPTTITPGKTSITIPFISTTTQRPRTRPSVISVSTVKTEGPLSARGTARPEMKRVTNSGGTR